MIAQVITDTRDKRTGEYETTTGAGFELIALKYLSRSGDPENLRPRPAVMFTTFSDLREGQRVIIDGKEYTILERHYAHLGRYTAEETA